MGTLLHFYPSTQKHSSAQNFLSMFCSSCFEPQMCHYDKSCWVFSWCFLKSLVPVNHPSAVWAIQLAMGFWMIGVISISWSSKIFVALFNITRNMRNHPRKDDFLYLSIISPEVAMFLTEVAKVMVFQMDNLWMSSRVSWIWCSMASNKWVPPTIHNWWSLWDSALAVFGQFCLYSRQSVHCSQKSRVCRFLFRSTCTSKSYSNWCQSPKEETSDSSLDGARFWKRWWQSRFLRFFVTKTVNDFGCFCLQGKRWQRKGKRWQRQGQRQRKRSGTGTLHIIAHCMKIELKTCLMQRFFQMHWMHCFNFFVKPGATWYSGKRCYRPTEPYELFLGVPTRCHSGWRMMNIDAIRFGSR